MASYTPNYNLKKPADSDSYDIADHNGNMDKIDAVLYTLNSKSLNKTTVTGTTSSNGNINISMGAEQYDIISVSYVGGIAIPYKANAYEWLVHVTDATLVPIASTSVSLEIIYTNKLS